MYKELRRRFKTTDMTESVHSLVGQKTDKVDCWRNSNQKIEMGGDLTALPRAGVE